MRKILDNISDPALIVKLTEISRQIDAKMKLVNALRNQMKKNELPPAQLQELKKISAEIDQLDKSWKDLAGI